jgi:hypothetical protein
VLFFIVGVFLVPVTCEVVNDSCSCSQECVKEGSHVFDCAQFCMNGYKKRTGRCFSVWGICTFVGG